MSYERFIFWFWESPTTGWHACKVKKHFNFLIMCIYFYLKDSQTIRSTINFSKPLLCKTLICCDWSISFKAVFVRQCCFVYSVTGETAVFNAPTAHLVAKNEFVFSFRPMRKYQQVGGNMLMIHVDVNMKRLGIGFKNDSFQWFRVDSFFWETITLYTVHFVI